MPPHSRRNHFDYSTTSMPAISSVEQTLLLEQENEQLRRQLMDAQDLLVRRNAQLAILEGELQTLAMNENVIVPQQYSSQVTIVTNEAVVGDVRRPHSPPDSLSSSHTPALGILDQQRRQSSVQKSTPTTTTTATTTTSNYAKGTPNNSNSTTIPDVSQDGITTQQSSTSIAHDSTMQASDVVSLGATTLTIDTDLSSTASPVAVVTPTNNKTHSSNHDDSALLTPSTSMASSTIYTEGTPLSRKKIQSSFHSSKLPREAELDNTEKENVMQVTNYTLVDGDDDEGRYTGSLSRLSRMPHGQGIMVYDQYRSYSGQWENGRWSGKGRMISRIFHYSGEFHKDQKHGYGILENKKTRVVYKGEFMHDKKHGKGSLVFPSGDAYYGYFRDNKFHGQGKLEFSDGSMYFGQWKDGKKSGQGILIGKDGSTIHQGMFLNDEAIHPKQYLRHEHSLDYKPSLAEI